MKLARRRRRRPEINVLPLIDVAMFLLIFFMMLGTLKSAEPVHILPPESVQGRPTERSDVNITLAGDWILLQGDSVTLPQLQTKLQALAENRLVIHADESSTAAQLLDVLQAANGAGMKDVALVTRQMGVP